MYKIGMIGAESSHAEDFAAILNRTDINTGEYRYPDFKVTAIYGEKYEEAKEVAETYNIPRVIKKLNKMTECVDAVMIVFRDGNLHLSLAEPFLKAGIPVWIDKPFTDSLEDCIKLLHLAKANGTLVTGGSTCMYNEGVQLAKQFVENESRLGEIQGGAMNYPADTQDDYGGFYFYAPHLCEMCLQIFGYDPVSVIASENKGNVSAVVKYPRYNIALNFLKNASEHLILINGSNSTMLQELDSPVLPYYNGFDKFIDMLQSKKMPLTYLQLYTSVALMNAVIQSYQEKREVELELNKEF